MLQIAGTLQLYGFSGGPGEDFDDPKEPATAGRAELPAVAERFARENGAVDGFSLRVVSRSAESAEEERCGDACLV